MPDELTNPKVEASESRGSALYGVLDAAEKAATARFTPQSGWSDTTEEFRYRLLLQCLAFMDEATLAAEIEAVFLLMEESRKDAAMRSRVVSGDESEDAQAEKEKGNEDEI